MDVWQLYREEKQKKNIYYTCKRYYQRYCDEDELGCPEMFHELFNSNVKSLTNVDYTLY